MRTVAATVAVAVVALATALGVDLPDKELAGMVTDLITAAVGIAAIIGATLRPTEGNDR